MDIRIVAVLLLSAIALSQSVITNQDIDAFLCKYGYADGMTCSRQLTSEERRTAVRKCQRFMNLNITGDVDPATEAKMRGQRCGCPDMMRKGGLMQTSMIQRPQQFTLVSSWPRTTVTWKLSGYTTQLDPYKTRSEVIRAFNVWAEHTPLIFIENNVTADIDISFQRNNHGDGAGNSFDGRGRVLAHAFFPTTGTTHFDDDEAWGFNNTFMTDFFTVCVHEFGHALGLSHSTIDDALMAPYYQGYNPNFKLHSDDIAGIQALYGGPVTTNPTTTRAPLTTPPPRTPAPTTPAPRTPAPRTLAPRTTTTTTIRPTTTTSRRPEWCDIPFTSIFRDFDGTVYAFQGRRALIIDIDGSVTESRPTSVFRNAPRNFRTAYNIQSIGQTFLMNGKLIRRYDEHKNYMGYIIMRATERDMPVEPMAAVALSQNTIYVFGNGIVFRVSATGEVVRGSHNYIEREFRGVPNSVTSAVMWSPSTIYFFDELRYYEYNVQYGYAIRYGDITSLLFRRYCSEN